MVDKRGRVPRELEIFNCTEHRRIWLLFSLTMAAFLFCTNLMIAMNLSKNGALNSFSRGMISRDTAELIEAPKMPRRLPNEFRYAHVCPAAKQKLLNFAPQSDAPKIPTEYRKEFVTGGYQKIHKGSGDYKLVGPLTTRLANIQHDDGIYGSVAELGVHHGRYTGALFITAKETEKMIAADLFEELQSQNIDASGFGDKQAFLAGLRTYGLNETDVDLIYTGSTEDIPFDWHRRANFEPFRMISVDAGHTARLTFNDLELAFCNALRGAIIILDDFFHNLWPGVTEGFFQFTTMGPLTAVYPFLRCEGKAFMTNDREFHQLYYRKLKNDPKLQSFLKPYAHKTRGVKVKYMMNGVEYLKCDSDELTREAMHLLWDSLLE